MLTCGDVGSDVHALIKELAIRRVQHRSETYSNESQHLAEGTELARLRRRFPFVLQQALSFRTRHHLCRQGVALTSTRRPHSQGPASVQAHRTGLTGSVGQKGANGVGGGIGVGGGNGDGNGDVDGHGDGDGAGRVLPFQLSPWTSFCARALFSHTHQYRYVMNTCEILGR